jgi:hypothetical protein
MAKVAHRPTGLPHGGELIFLSPACGVWGYGAAWWHVIRSTEGLIEGHAYVTAGPLATDADAISGDSHVFYIRLADTLVMDPC